MRGEAKQDRSGTVPRPICGEAEDSKRQPEDASARGVSCGRVTGAVGGCGRGPAAKAWRDVARCSGRDAYLRARQLRSGTGHLHVSVWNQIFHALLSLTPPLGLDHRAGHLVSMSPQKMSDSTPVG